MNVSVTFTNKKNSLNHLQSEDYWRKTLWAMVSYWYNIEESVWSTMMMTNVSIKLFFYLTFRSHYYLGVFQEGLWIFGYYYTIIVFVLILLLFAFSFVLIDPLIPNITYLCEISILIYICNANLGQLFLMKLKFDTVVLIT